MAVLQILLTLGHFCFIQADYYIGPAISDRDNARNVCRLATPEILFSEEGNIVVVNTIHFQDVTKLWVGYALELTTFLYIGCSSQDDIKDNAKMSNIYKKDPGQCYSFCETSFFGMQESNCYCIFSPPKNVGSINCKLTCDHPKDTLCGQKGNEKDVSVYMKVDDTSDCKSNGQYCQAVQRSSEDSNFSLSYVWEACDKELKFICQTGPFTEPSQQFTATDVVGNWHESMTICIVFGLHPAEKIDNIDQDKVSDINKRWLGKIRSFVIKKTEDNSNLNHLDVHQGYIERDKDTVLLKFDQSFEDPLHALCGREHDTTLTFSSTPKSTGGNDLLLAIFLSAVVLLIVIIVTSVILTLRWKRRHAVGKRAEHDSARSIHTVINRSNSDGNVQQKKSVNENAVVEVAKINATVNDEYHTPTNLRPKANITSDDTDDNYTKLEDRTDDTYTKLEDLTDDTYTKLEDRTDDTYTKLEDRTDDTYTKLGDRTDDTYTELEDRTDDTYTKLGDRTDDTYTKLEDRTDDTFTKMEDRTDDTYTKLEDRTDDTYTKLGDRTDDTYTKLEDRTDDTNTYTSLTQRL